jgi:hypothetical protein
MELLGDPQFFIRFKNFVPSEHCKSLYCRLHCKVTGVELRLFTVNRPINVRLKFK